MKKAMRRRDTGIELARVFGCLIVIGVHISLQDTTDGVYDLSRGIINCFLADGVAIFWLITGCFLFRSGSYKRVLIRTAKTIALPLALISLFVLHFSGWLSNGGDFFQSIRHTPQEYWDGLKSALALNNPIPGSVHLWYCYAYILVMIGFPVLYQFVLWLDEDSNREKWFCVITFGLLALNDFSKNKMLGFSHHGLNAAVPAAIEMLWGHILYKHRNDFKGKRIEKFLPFAAICCFGLLNLIRMYIVRGSGSKAILYWYSTIGLVCALSVVVFCLWIGNRLKADGIGSRIIQTVAGYTFLIYVVHLVVRAVLYRHRVNTRCLKFLARYLDGFLLEICYTAVFVMLVFLVSMAVSILLRGLICLARRIISGVSARL